MKIKNQLAMISATLLVVSCNSLTVQDPVEPPKDSENKTVVKEVVKTDLFNGTTWVYEVFKKEWAQIPGMKKTFGKLDSISIVDTLSDSIVFFGVDGSLGSAIGTFDSISIAYKSNYPFQISLGTAKGDSIWESTDYAKASAESYSRQTFTGSKFIQTAPDGKSGTHATAKVLAFTNCTATKLVKGNFTIKVKEITLYKNK